VSARVAHPSEEESLIPTLPEARVGDPIRHEALTVFPLFTEGDGAVDYLLADEAIAAGAVTVEEVGESGSVPDLLVENKGDCRVLFIEGEELRGAKQNRVLNTSVLVAARSRTKIPVSCVEQGRWRYRSRQFGYGGSHSSSKLRHILKRSVTRSTREGEGHGSDQGEVWREVGRQMASLGSWSETMAMSDAYDSHRPRLVEFQERLGYVEGATGLAVAVGKAVVAVDLFDKPATCRKAWGRLLTGVVMDALEAKPEDGAAGAAAVEALLKRLRAAPWRQAPAVGEGEEYRRAWQGRSTDGRLVCGRVGKIHRADPPLLLLFPQGRGIAEGTGGTSGSSQTPEIHRWLARSYDRGGRRVEGATRQEPGRSRGHPPADQPVVPRLGLLLRHRDDTGLGASRQG